MLDLAALPQPIKSGMVLATDVLLLPLALWMAFGFRLGPFDPSRPLGLIDPFAWIEPADVAIIWLGSVGILAGFRFYRIKLHTIDLDAIRRIALCSAAIGFFAATAAFFLQTVAPRSIPVLFGASFLLLAVCVRIAALRFLLAASRFGSNRKPGAIYVAGAAGIQLAASLKQSAELEPVIFVDDNPSLHNIIVSGIRVKPLGKLNRAANERRVEQVLIAIPSLPLVRKENLIREMREIGCKVKVVPSYVDFVSGKANLESLTAVDPDDLLGRDKVDLDSPEIAKAYAGRSVMVTGPGEVDRRGTVQATA